MNSIIKEIVLAVAVFFGIFQGQNEPVLLCRVWKTGNYIKLNADIKNGINKKIEELISAGTVISIHVTSWFDHKKAQSAVHTISYNPFSGIAKINISETGKTHRTKNMAAALYILTKFNNLKICSIDEFNNSEDKSIKISASINLPDEGIDKSIDPTVLWGYRDIIRIFKYNSITEIPY
ncbi:MAG: DUF4390 domain-containing protein [Spirochaetes bacterium]|nr:DUF4390 domain-containing protein [Spirochaetota bacterium]